MFNELTLLVPTCKCPDYTKILIRSFEKFKPADLTMHYVVVENSDDDSFAKECKALASNITWIQNPLDMSKFPPEVKGSFANADGVVKGLGSVKTSLVFIAHVDTCVTSPAFFTEMRNKALDNVLVGTVKDNTRVKAIHVSGYLTTIELAKLINFYPTTGVGPAGTLAINDVGDELDLLCRSAGLPTFCFQNTHNGAPIPEGPFKTFSVDRCFDSKGNVMFIHLGRGIYKLNGQYAVPTKVLTSEWIERCSRILNDENP